MSDSPKIRVVLLWHMHQPYYFNGESDQFELPWTYLHATKDYIDMANILAANPKARAVVNFAPILLEQLEDYTCQIDAYAKDKAAMKDPLLAQLVSQDIPEDPAERKTIIECCLRANEQYLINRFAAYKDLAALGKDALKSENLMQYLHPQFFFDLLCWYHIAWLGETIKRSHPVAMKLIQQAQNFDADHRHELLMLIRELVSDVIPKYRQLSENNQVELAFSPYAHPIIPLLLDFESTHDAMPGADLPQHAEYPDGEARARWHFEQGAAVFEKYFHHKPSGCWPSEGSVSEATIRLANEAGIRWMASGESVMRNSIGQTPSLAQLLEGQCLHRSYHFDNQDLKLFFRDDGLSDLIGFTFSNWHANDAVNNLIHHIENIAEACEYEKNTVVPIILDGENAWEHYPENAFHFLNALYAKLATHPKIDLTTFSDCIDAGIESVQLDAISAGSWVYGTFSTWIGDKDKNRGWDLLVEAKQAYDEAIRANGLSEEEKAAAQHQLAICEGSDWFWWFGDYNPSESVQDFERLYRIQLKTLYQLIKREPPLQLNEVISTGGGKPATGGVMRPGQETHH